MGIARRRFGRELKLEAGDVGGAVAVPLVWVI